MVNDIVITSSQNQWIKKLSLYLKKGKSRKEDGVFVCEGKKMFFEILEQNPKMIIRSFVRENSYNELSEEEKEKLNSLTVDRVEEKVFDGVSETVTPQGFLAIVKMPKYELSDLAYDGRRILILDDLQDPGNLGTILRTAEAAGMTGIILSKGSVDVTNPKVVRSTMGAILRMPIIYSENLIETIGEIKDVDKNFAVYASALDASVPFDTIDYGNSYGIVVGNEANGVSKELQMASDNRIHIPMCGMVESLNAAVAAAVLMYNAKRK